MTTQLPDWKRPSHQPGGGNAMVFYALYGHFTKPINIMPEIYRTTGVPPGITVKLTNREQHPVLPFTEASFARIMQTNNPELFKRIQTAPECIVIQGEIADPSDLNYLRDTIGVATYFLDNGAIGLIDPQQLKLYDGATWRKEIFLPNPPNWLDHAVILVSRETENMLWIHTRGTRKFGRPDLSIRNVPSSYRQAVIDLCNRFIRLQANGEQIAEGQEIVLPTLPPGLACHHAGNLEDPDFNNVHIEIQFPLGN
ncbi:hypothetical protein [Pedosphaera parvula]|nr:hypothetical protein [Pedosphaera parvula]